MADPSAFYRWCFDSFYHHLPHALRAHRAYFHNVPKNRRGFGEDCFHVMWGLLLSEFAPGNFLEIGVFRGQVISLVSLWAALEKRPCAVYGISPFSSAGDSATTYRKDIDYYHDCLENFDHFNLPRPTLLRAQSQEPVAARLIESVSWDLIYIDGNHDYPVVKKDWEICSRSVKPGGLIVLDDAGLGTSFAPPPFATKGQPGPSQVAREIAPALFRELLQVGHNRVFQRLPAKPEAKP
jgi:SAM-dependent methyltransferase